VPDQCLPRRIVTVKQLVAQQGTSVFDGQPGQRSYTDRPELSTQWPELQWLLAASDNQAALVRCFGDLTEQRAEPLVAGTVVARAAAGLEHRLEIVQDQQAACVA